MILMYVDVKEEREKVQLKYIQARDEDSDDLEDNVEDSKSKDENYQNAEGDNSSSIIRGSDDTNTDDREIPLKHFKVVVERMIGKDAADLLIKVLINRKGIRFSESSGPKLAELKKALQELIGIIGTRMIIEKIICS
jgi:hypothetical protein